MTPETMELLTDGSLGTALLGVGGTVFGRLAGTAIAVIVVWVLRWVVLAVAQPRIDDARTRYLWRKTSSYTAIGLSALCIASIWWSGFTGFATFLGLLSAGVAVALRDWIANFFGWLYILTWRPFGVGDRIQIGEVKGDVIDVGLQAISLLEIGNWVQADQSTGRLLHVPNGRVLVQPTASYTAGLAYLWHELQVMVTFESDWRGAKQLLDGIARAHCEKVVAEAEQALDEASKKWLITYSNLTPIVYTRVDASGVTLTVRYLTPPRGRRGSEQAMWEAILDAFDERDDIDLAYPTRRYVGDGEGPADATTP